VGQAFKQNRAVTVSSGVLTNASTGEPQTLLLVGDDRRPAPKGHPNNFEVPHSNEMLLVRLDPSKPTIAMLSIPRELKVQIYPHGAKPTVNRINFAYTLGGIQLMTETIKRVLGLKINHVVVMTFPHFKRAVDKMGCVYTTIDRRYYHSNANSVQQYFEVNLQPGYQKVCGDQALQFVAYRHGDTSLVRDARDQRFLLDVKAQYGPVLLDQRDKFEQIFGRAVETDIRGSDEILNLVELLAQMAGRPVRQVHFDVNTGPSFDTASPQQINRAVTSFLRGVIAGPKPRIRAAVAGAKRRRPPQGLALTRTPPAYLAHARDTAKGMSLPLEYPRVRNQVGNPGPDQIRDYLVHDESGNPHEAYVVVIDRGSLGDYYDVQGMRWTDPPILRNPSQTVHIGRRTYGLYYGGDNMRLVAWREGPAVYWIENTLTNAIPPAEMLAMAEQTKPVVGPGAGGSAQVHPHNFVLPKRTSLQPEGTAQTIGAILALLGLGGIVALAVSWSRRRRAIRQVRADLEEIIRAEARIARKLSSRRSAPRPTPPPPVVRR
jgi:LCP family protein required for cell wall assembly